VSTRTFPSSSLCLSTKTGDLKKKTHGKSVGYVWQLMQIAIRIVNGNVFENGRGQLSNMSRF